MESCIPTYRIKTRRFLQMAVTCFSARFTGGKKSEFDGVKRGRSRQCWALIWDCVGFNTIAPLSEPSVCGFRIIAVVLSSKIGSNFTSSKSNMIQISFLKLNQIARGTLMSNSIRIVKKHENLYAGAEKHKDPF